MNRWKLILITFSIFLLACSTTELMTQLPSVPPVISDSINALSFVAYATESIENGRACVVGTSTDSDGMNQKPFVRLTDTPTNQVLWNVSIPIPIDTYQSRATHCAYSSEDDSLFVLLQSDTQPQQAMAQTLLSVAKLSAVDGTTQGIKPIEMGPAFPTALSAWVTKGVENFEWQGDALAVSGHYFLLTNRNKIFDFELKLSRELALVPSESEGDE